MPEGSDIFACVLYLKELLESNEYEVYSNSLQEQLKEITSFGKALRIHLQNYMTIEIHLGLSGSIRINTTLLELPKRIGKLQIIFRNPLKIICLNCSDIFIGGHLQIVPTISLENLSLKDPLYMESPAEILESLIQMRNRNGRTLLVNAITDQKKRFVGIGNFLAAEILYASKLAPRKQMKLLTNQELHCLATSIFNEMRHHTSNALDSIRKTNQVGSEGRNGSESQREGRIYHRATDPEGNEVLADETIRPNRIFYWCPTVQQ